MQMKRFACIAALLSGLLLTLHPANGREETLPVCDWILFPDYQLPGDAANPVGPRVPLPESLTRTPDEVPPPYPYRDGEPSQRWFPDCDLPFRPPFTVELWTTDHSHYPTGLALMAWADGDEPLFRVAYYDNALEVRQGNETVFHPTEWRSAYNRYWRHLVLSVDQDNRGAVNYNGQLIGELQWSDRPDARLLEISAYNARDPLMRIENLLHRCRIYPRALDQGEVREAFAELSTLVWNGIRYPGLFHFIAGPALTYVSPESVLLSCEADQPTRATLHWGRDRDTLDQSTGIPTLTGIHSLRIDGLDPDTLYYYQVELENRQGTRIDSGILSFRTAPGSTRPITFAAIGDTEARPWISDVIAKRIWSHGVDFVVHMGDLTDNGKQDRKPQWTHEYFAGMTQLQSRVPVFAVPGNGEGDDLYWFKRYFPHPRDQENQPGFYRFTYGPVDFFMLNSNARSDEFQPGGLQYRWLAEQLSQSSAAWKVVCFHHVGTPSTFGNNTEVNGLVPLFDRFGVNLVLNGHIHTYERSHPRKAGLINPSGTTYIVTGGAGGNLKDEGGSGKSPFSAHVHRGYNYLLVAADPARMEISMYDLEGQLHDRILLESSSLGWSTTFPEAVPSSDSRWIFDPVLGWVYVAEWPWCYVLKPEITYPS